MVKRTNETRSLCTHTPIAQMSPNTISRSKLMLRRAKSGTWRFRLVRRSLCLRKRRIYRYRPALISRCLVIQNHSKTMWSRNSQRYHRRSKFQKSLTCHMRSQKSFKSKFRCQKHHLNLQPRGLSKTSKLIDLIRLLSNWHHLRGQNPRSEETRVTGNKWLKSPRLTLHYIFHWLR